MIQRINTHKTIVMNLVPFPGTDVFAQAIKDDLLVGVEQDSLYLAANRYFTNYDQIFLKPYALELDDIREFREKCDNLLLERQSAQMKV